jgi:hypothetical protein
MTTQPTLHLRYALDALRGADDALGDTLDALADVQLEEQGLIGSYDVIGWRETCRLFASIFAPAELTLGPRLALAPGMLLAIRERIEEVATDPKNLPGIDRAAVALEFAVASLGDVLDALDEEGEGDEWYRAATAAQTTLEMIGTRIGDSIIRNRPDGGQWFSRN